MKTCYVVAASVILAVAVILSNYMGHFSGWTAANHQWEKKTVAQNVAEWVVQPDGSTDWQWKSDKKEK